MYIYIYKPWFANIKAYEEWRTKDGQNPSYHIHCFIHEFLVLGFVFLFPPPTPLLSHSLPLPPFMNLQWISPSPESLTQQALQVGTDTHTYMTSKVQIYQLKNHRWNPGTLSTYHSPLCKRMLLFPASSSATLQSTQHYHNYYYHHHWQIHDFCISQ
jgi:hypothetical protein